LITLEPNPADYVIDNITFIYNVTDLHLEYYYFNITNSTGGIILSYNTSTNLTLSTSLFPNIDTYTFTIFANDSAGNIYVTPFDLIVLNNTDIDAPNITIISPTPTNNPNPITYDIRTDRVSYCEYILNEESRKPLPTTNNLSFGGFTQLIAGTEHTLTIFCQNTAGNESNITLNFIMGTISGNGSVGAGGSGTTLPERITLERISFLPIEKALFNIENKIFVETLDLLNNRTEVNEVSVNILNAPYRKLDIKRISLGLYEITFLVDKQNITSLEMNVTATQREKIVSENQVIFISEPTKFEEIKGEIKSSLSRLERFIRSHLIETILLLGVIIFSIIMLSFYVLLGKRKKNH
jgi:hypothetical protein